MLVILSIANSMAIKASYYNVLLLFLVWYLFAAHSSAKLIEVHLIPHSHCDPGWKESFDVRTKIKF